jgi:hypothetical protein
VTPRDRGLYTGVEARTPRSTRLWEPMAQPAPATGPTPAGRHTAADGGKASISTNLTNLTKNIVLVGYSVRLYRAIPIEKPGIDGVRGADEPTN